MQTERYVGVLNHPDASPKLLALTSQAFKSWLQQLEMSLAFKKVIQSWRITHQTIWNSRHTPAALSQAAPQQPTLLDCSELDSLKHKPHPPEDCTMFTEASEAVVDN